MRRRLVGGNWKLMCDSGTLDMLGGLRRGQFRGVDAFIAVPSIYIPLARGAFPDYVAVGAQDVSEYEEGAYTGEVSARMLREQGVRYVLLGHSERRLHLGESCERVQSKLQRCLGHGLRPVLCIGESSDCRRAGGHLGFLRDQLRRSVGSAGNIELDIAYEPVWAIGGDETASCDDIAEAAEHIRGWAEELQLRGRVLYGGAVSMENIDSIAAVQSIDGVLVGGSSLSAEFGRIAQRMAVPEDKRQE